MIFGGIVCSASDSAPLPRCTAGVNEGEGGAKEDYEVAERKSVVL